MPKSVPDKSHSQPPETFLQDRRQILKLPAEQALAHILEAPDPQALVQSFPEEDFYFLIHDIGINDSSPLLALASEDQCEYILDLEIWDRDRIDMTALSQWITILMDADPNRFLAWFADQKIDCLDFYLYRNIEVVIRAPDQDPAEIGKDFFTLDDAFYIRIIEDPLEPNAPPDAKKRRHGFIKTLLERLANYDHIYYQYILLETAAVLPAESEEEAYRLRNTRLAEKGFLPFEEAVGIYQPMSLEKMKAHVVTEKTGRQKAEPLVPVPLYSQGLLVEGTLFTSALKTIEDDSDLHALQIEFASLANQIIAADRKIIKVKSELQEVVKKACGYLSIGLKRLLPTDTDFSQPAAALLLKHPLHQIFRLGYGQVLELKWRAEKWRRVSWFEAQGLPLSFWGEEWLGAIGGLFIKKPLFFDNYRTGSLYREFFTETDIGEIENILEDIMAFDNLLSHLNLSIAPKPKRIITYKNILLTIFARRQLGLDEAIESIRLNQFKHFFENLWIEGQEPRKINPALKAKFLEWLSERSGIALLNLSEKYAQPLEKLFMEIENEYLAVATKDLAPRHIYLFLVEK